MLLGQGRSALDPAERHSLYVQCQKEIIAQAYVLPLYFLPDISLTSTRLGNYYPNATPAGNAWNSSDWYLQRVSMEAH